MTRPAQNESQVIPAGLDAYSKGCGSGFVFSNHVVHNNAYIYQLVRDASVKIAKDSSGWRDPTSYGAFGWRADAATLGSGTNYLYGTCSPPNQRDFAGSYYQGSIYSAGGVFALPGFFTWMTQSANSKALLKLKNQDVNLSVAFAERKETEELVVDVLKRITASVKAFKGGKPKLWNLVKKTEGTSRWRETPQEWLRVQYGWNPLLADVVGAGKHLDRRERDHHAYFANVKANCQNDEKVHVGLLGGPISFCFEDCWQDTFRQTTVQLWYNLNNPVLATFSSLGLTNPAALLWERLGYSFVVDWFLPVGDWLNAMDADFGWIFKAGRRTQFLRSQGRSYPTVVGGSPTNYGVVSNSTIKARGFRFQRTYLGSPPGVSLPRFKNPLGGKHIANAFSLLLNVFRR